MSQKTENELLFTREVLCAMIELAIDDARKDYSKFLRENTKNNQQKNQLDAIHFIRSKGFEDICNALGLAADKFRLKAFL
jgi:hypothetical protein